MSVSSLESWHIYLPAVLCCQDTYIDLTLSDICQSVVKEVDGKTVVSSATCPQQHVRREESGGRLTIPCVEPHKDVVPV